MTSDRFRRRRPKRSGALPASWSPTTAGARPPTRRCAGCWSGGRPLLRWSGTRTRADRHRWPAPGWSRRTRTRRLPRHRMSRDLGQRARRAGRAMERPLGRDHDRCSGRPAGGRGRGAAAGALPRGPRLGHLRRRRRLRRGGGRGAGERCAAQRGGRRRRRARRRLRGRWRRRGARPGGGICTRLGCGVGRGIGCGGPRAGPAGAGERRHRRRDRRLLRPVARRPRRDAGGRPTHRGLPHRLHELGRVGAAAEGTRPPGAVRSGPGARPDRAAVRRRGASSSGSTPRRRPSGRCAPMSG